jgi:hypothetical protein
MERRSAGPVEQAIDNYFERVNADDIEGVAALFTSEATVRAPGFPELHGRAEIAHYYKRLLAPFAKHVDIPTRTSNKDRSPPSTLTSVRRWEMAARPLSRHSTSLRWMPMA